MKVRILVCLFLVCTAPIVTVQAAERDITGWINFQVLKAEDVGDPFSPANGDGNYDTNTLRVVYGVGPVSMDRIMPVGDASPIDLINRYQTNRHAVVRMDYALYQSDGSPLISFHRELEYTAPLDIVYVNNVPCARIAVEIPWDGKDSSGAFVPDGTYGYSINADLFSYTGDMHGHGTIPIVTPPGDLVLATIDEIQGEVTIDNTPPDVSLSWPPLSPFGTDREEIEIVGTIIDQISGVNSALLSDLNGTVFLSNPGFEVQRQLNTEIPSETSWQVTAFLIEAEDNVANAVSYAFEVHYTLGLTLAPSDPANVQWSSFGPASPNRAIIGFHPSTSRDRWHELVASGNGRVASIFPSTSSVVAQFETQNVAELLNVLSELRAQEDVEFTVPVTVLQVNQPSYDNDVLTSPENGAYVDVRSMDAKRWIHDQGIQLHPVNVIAIDSGLDDQAGIAGELNGIPYYDIQTAEGRAGVPGVPVDAPGWPQSVPHGTWVSSVIAGANNGSGNNGVTAGLPGNPIRLSVIGLDPEGDGWMTDLEQAAYSLILSGNIGQVDVVNMSYGNTFPIPLEDEDYRNDEIERYRRFFDTDRGRGILWVAAAGNDNTEDSCAAIQFVPSGVACFFDNVVSVAAHRFTDGMKEWFSNFGDPVTLSAPGHTWVSHNGSPYQMADGSIVNGLAYVWAQGTSFSAPLVTGAAALLESTNYPLPPAFIKQALRESVRQSIDPSLPGALDILSLVQTNYHEPLPAPVTFMGAAAGSDTQAISSLDRIPGLTGFAFNFRHDDHHLEEFAISLASDRVSVAYNDKNDDDMFSWWIDAQPLPSGTSYGSVSGTSSWGMALSPILPHSAGTYVITGFAMEFLNGDHHVSDVSIRLDRSSPDGVRYRITYRDKNFDDPFRWRVDYALIPADRVLAGDFEFGGLATGRDARAVVATNPVLTGFELSYWPPWDDHQVDEMAIRLNPSTLYVALNDKNDDDEFIWRVHWADIR